MYSNYEYEHNRKLTEDEVNLYIEKYKEWKVLDQELSDLIWNYSSYIKKICKEQLKKHRIEQTEDNLGDVYNEWIIVFLKNIRGYDKKKGGVLTYLKNYLKDWISKAVVRSFNLVRYSEVFSFYLSDINYRRKRSEESWEIFDIDQYIEDLTNPKWSKLKKSTKILLKQYVEWIQKIEEKEEKKEEERFELTEDKVLEILREMNFTDLERKIFLLRREWKTMDEVTEITWVKYTKQYEAYQWIIKWLRYYLKDYQK